MTKETVIETERSCIRGAFVLATRVKNKKIMSIIMIKLTAINLIEPLDQDDEDQEVCVFYTYKDCKYYSPVRPYELTCAINTLLFDQEKHWERYPD